MRVFDLVKNMYDEKNQTLLFEAEKIPDETILQDCRNLYGSTNLLFEHVEKAPVVVGERIVFAGTCAVPEFAGQQVWVSLEANPGTALLTRSAQEQPVWSFRSSLEIKKQTHLTVEAKLKRGVVHFQDLLASLGLPEGAPDFTIRDLRVALSPLPAFRYDLHAELADFKLPGLQLDIPLKQLRMTLQSGTEGGTPVVDLIGLFRVANVDLELSVDSRDGWTFKGRTKPGQVIDINDLLAYLADCFGVELPPELVHIRLQDLQLQLKIGAVTSFVFTCNGAFELVGQSLQAQFKAEFNSDQKGYALDLKGSLWIGEHCFALAFEHSNKRTKGERAAAGGTSAILSGSWKNRALR